MCLQSSDSHWLSPADRDQQVMELRATGWVEVEDRDAIFKELHFKTFNQVRVCIYIHVFLTQSEEHSHHWFLSLISLIKLKKQTPRNPSFKNTRRTDS